MSRFDLRGDGKVVLVSGAASGLGLGLAQVFGEAGYRLAMLDVDGAALETAARRLTDDGRECLALTADVTDAAQLDSAFAAVRERWSRPDTVINNAGILGAAASIENLDEGDLDRVLAVDLKGPFLVCQRAVRAQLESGGGKEMSILNISSITADSGAAVYPAYSAAKAGVVALTRSIARRVGRFNVRVNSLHPGSLTGTGFMQAQQEKAREIHTGLIQKSPVGRLARPEDVAVFALFLASRLARHVHGAVLTVDGGESLGYQ